MNKGIIFVLGVVTGAIAGGVGTYFMVKDHYISETADIIDEYAQHCEERIEEMKLKYCGDACLEETEKNPKECISAVEHGEEAITNNEGVKKYHHSVKHTDSLNVPIKEEKTNVTEGEKAIKLEEQGVPRKNQVYEITEDQYCLEAQMYDKVNLEYYCEDDMLMCVDPEEMAETHYNIGREELIGDSWRLGQDYIPDGADCGSIFVRNDSMSMDFEIVVYDKSWHEIAGEGVEEDA